MFTSNSSMIFLVLIACQCVSSGDVLEIFPEFKEMKQELKAVKSEMEKQKNKANTNVAFTYMSHADLNNVGVGQKIIFDRKVLDTSSSYSTSSGIFTAPVKGYYYIQINNIVGWKSQACYLSINKNGNREVSTFADDQWDTSTTSAVIDLNKGDRISFENRGYKGYTCTIDKESNVVGFLLHAA